MIARNPLSSEAPSGFPSRRWDQLRRDVTDFLVSPWAEEAARLGWTDLDLFGVDADRPYTRIDGLGLVPALEGCKIVASAPRTRPSKRPAAHGRATAENRSSRVGCWCRDRGLGRQPDTAGLVKRDKRGAGRRRALAVSTCCAMEYDILELLWLRLQARVPTKGA